MASTWWKLEVGAYTNSDYVFSVYPYNDGGTWKIQVVTTADPTEGFNLEGTYADEPAATAAVKNLVNGVTAADLIS